jgi:hypothetical protein
MIFLAPQLIAQQRTAMIHLAHRRLHAAVGHARQGPRQDDYPLRAECAPRASQAGASGHFTVRRTGLVRGVLIRNNAPAAFLRARLFGRGGTGAIAALKSRLDPLEHVRHLRSVPLSAARRRNAARRERRRHGPQRRCAALLHLPDDRRDVRSEAISVGGIGRHCRAWSPERASARRAFARAPWPQRVPPWCARISSRARARRRQQGCAA